MTIAKERYDALSSTRSQYLNIAEEASTLTLPYLVREDETYNRSARNLITPYQSVGAKGVVTLASKLMLALLPPQTSFFKLQVDEQMLGQIGDPAIKSELDLAFSKIERTILDAIAASDDRVVVHQALKHLVVSGNALIYMAKSGLKLFPLNRFVVERDGDGNILEIVTKERISRKLLETEYGVEAKPPVDLNTDYSDTEDVDVYTYVRREKNQMIWHQEVFGEMIEGTNGKSPLDTNPWIALRFQSVDGESYGRGRVEEFMGDLKSLEALSQALVEGSAAAAKVVFTVSPSSTTKPSTLAKAGNGAIIQGRPDDIGVVQVGKTADFATAYQMMQQLERRLSEAFLILTVRQSERTTAEEVRMTQMELEQQLGGLFSLLTVDFLKPYLARKMSVFERTGDIPKLPEGIVTPVIVAGINALGRGQDQISLGQFVTTIAQTMGPEAISQYINPDEFIKRLAASQGIDVLNLVKSQEQIQQERQQAMQQAQQMELTKQQSKFAQVQQQAVSDAQQE
tara:strand:+ start:356 stop:1894 length:1539 start_codon:yes stop_codon:yes gene_type:complete